MILGVNSVGVVSAFWYLRVYSKHTKGPGFRQNVIKAAICTYVPLIIVQFIASYSEVVLFVGYYASVMSVLLFGSPLVNLVR